MATYIIGYDLNREGANYSARNKALTDRIKELFPTYWHHLDSTWLVVSSYTAVQIRDDLGRFLDNNDELFVGTVGAPAAWKGFSQRGSSWLKSHL
ncbi:hypothetical protein AKJ13_15835 [Methylobacterium sp. ARG-1]|nr:hypothetical protein AKJ13_15835 [Methylobacterium sp. ARG-1]